MVAHDGVYNVWPPTEAPLMNVQREDQLWRHFDNTVNAVSFGFVATAILISMFLAMAIFERFLGPTSGRMTVYGDGVSVLMPGDNIPTFIAHPAPVPCPPERVSYPHDQQHINPLPNPAAYPDTNSSSSSISAQQN
ncbi:alpha/beta-Hydrolases superfamily protein [Salix suchowensis]|nr:alpha/beta-Hydrolases superfamily protein [Salix suchowensis]